MQTSPAKSGVRLKRGIVQEMRNQSELQKDTTKEQAQQWDKGKEERTGEVQTILVEGK